MSKEKDNIQKAATDLPERRKQLFTAGEKTVLLAIAFGVIAALFPRLLDLIQFKGVDISVGVSVLSIGIVNLIAYVLELIFEHFFFKKWEIRRTMYWVIVHILVIVALIGCIIYGNIISVPDSINNPANKFYETALSCGLTTFFYLIFHFVRWIVLLIVNEINNKNKKKKK